jgi:curved DNA-binding protein CbpA
MKRIADYKKLFSVEGELELSNLKSNYRKLVKDWHPDKFQDEDPKKAEAEKMSTEIIEAYHFLVSMAPETLEANLPEYNDTISKAGISDFAYKGVTLKVSFQNGARYEYFGVQKNVYTKLVNAPSQERFARRHIFKSHKYRQLAKVEEVMA